MNTSLVAIAMAIYFSVTYPEVELGGFPKGKTRNSSDMNLPIVSNYPANCRFIEFSNNAELFEIGDISWDKTSK